MIFTFLGIVMKTQNELGGVWGGGVQICKSLDNYSLIEKIVNHTSHIYPVFQNIKNSEKYAQQTFFSLTHAI